MSDAMVTGRMPQEKKAKGAAVLARSGLSASQAINLLYDRLIEEQDAAFLQPPHVPTAADMEAAARFVDALSEHRPSRFDGMTKREVKCERLAAKGLV